MSTRTVTSQDGRYQYQLQRWWNTRRPPAVFVTLHPTLTRDDVLACLAYSARLMKHHYSVQAVA